MKLLASAAAFALVAGSTFASHAQSDYPTKPVKILVGYQPGGPTDLTARLIANKLQVLLGQPFIVENKAGAGSNIASEQVATSPPDGYTLMVAASQMTWNGILYKGVKYDPLRSFAPIGKIMTSPAVLVVAPTFPAKTVSELIEQARRKPGTVTFASSGNGTVPHLSGELLKANAKIDIVHVPYRGAGPALTDLLSGQVNMSFMTALSAMSYIREGKLKPLAVTGDHRLPQLPNVPTLSEAGVSGVDIESWNGLFAPAGTPQPIVQKLSDALVKVLKEPDVRKVFEDQAAVVAGNSASEFSAQLRAEVQRNTKFVKSANLKID